MAAGSLKLGGFLAAMGAVAQALDAAHEQGIYHGDLKPSNILFDKPDNALVADFGLLLASFSNVDITRTTGYVSPEVLDGKPVSSRSDQYSLAVVIYEAITGRLPVNDGSSGPVLPPPANTLNEQISPVLATLLEQALSANPEDRFDSLTDFANALQASANDTELSLPASYHQEAPTPVPASVSQAAGLSQETLAQLAQEYEAGLAAMRLEDWATAIDSFRRVEEIDRHYRSVVVLRRTCERSLNNARHKPTLGKPASDSSSAARMPASKIIEGAGGVPYVSTISPHRSTWKIVIPIILVLAIGLTAVALLGQPTRTSVTSAEPEPVTPVAITSANAVAILTPVTNTLWRINEYNAPITNDNLVPLPQENEKLSVIVLDGTLEFALPDGTRVIAEKGTAVYFNSFSGWQGAEITSLTLEKGKLVAVSSDVVSVENPFGANVEIVKGTAGISFTEEEFRFDVDCLSGSCILHGDLGGETVVSIGERAFVGGSGKPGEVEPASYEEYANLLASVRIPSPTPTVALTSTPIPTSSPAPTASPEPSPTATATRLLRATSTPTPTATTQYIAKPAPRISTFTCSQPGQFKPSESIPFQWAWSGKLGSGEYLELRIGPQGSTNLTSIGTVPSDASVTWLIAASQFYHSTAYDYHWEIVHMAKNGKTVLARSERGCLHVAP